MSRQAATAFNEVGFRTRQEIPDGRRRIGARLFDYPREVAVMAIVNRTPHYFFDQGAMFASLPQARRMRLHHALVSGSALLLRYLRGPST